MARLLELEATKTYATKINAMHAVEKYNYSDNLRYIIMQNDAGRFFPVFIGERAALEGVHYNFHIVS